MRKSILLFLATSLTLSMASAQPQSSEQSAKAGEAQPVDPLDRTTPRKALVRFIDLAQKGNYELATQYLQLKVGRVRKTEAEGVELSRQLKVLLDRNWEGQLNAVSNDPSGRLDDGLPPELERAGEIRIEGNTVALLLVQVSEKNVGKVWLISAETLRQVPELYELIKFLDFEEHLPEVLVQTRFLSMPLWQWIAIILLYPVALGVAWFILLVLGLAKWGIQRGLKWIRRQSWKVRPHLPRLGPVTLLLMLLLHYSFLRALGVPLLYRQYYGQVVGIPVAIAVYWMLARMTDFLSGRLAARLSRTSVALANSVFLLGRRILKVVILVLLVLLVLQSFGVNVSAAWAGIGIGSIALGLGAQKTLENLFGGISLLSDQTFQVGDFCKVADQSGTVEDIGLRSTRIRTIDRTVVTIPNGALSNANLENISRRDKILFKLTPGLRFETSADQLRFLLAEIRKLLYQHPKVESSSARVRLLRFGQSSIDLEIFSYILTTDYPEFLAIQEDLLLRIMDLVGESGTSMAFPSQTLYLGKETGPDQEKARAAEAEVERWRKNKELPFPNHDPATIAKVENTLEYPSPDSALRNAKE